MAFTKSITILSMLFSISMVYGVNEKINEVSLVPKYWLTYNLEQQLDYTCTAVFDGIRLMSNNTNDLRFFIGYIVPNIDKYSFYLKPSSCHDSYCDTRFNLTIEDLRSQLNSSNSEFDVECIAFIVNETYGIMSSASVHYSEGKQFGEECSKEVLCNQNANLTCDSNICVCKQSFVAINITDNKQQCYSKAFYGDSCSYDQQCMDKNSLCNGESALNKTCECIEYYVYNGYYCCSNTSWCSFLWFDYDWFSYYWTDVVVIMIALSFGLLILTIVIAVSISMRMRDRRAGEQPLDANLKCPQNYAPKQFIGYYFGKKGEDKQILTEHDYNKN